MNNILSFIKKMFAIQQPSSDNGHKDVHSEAIQSPKSEQPQPKTIKTNNEMKEFNLDRFITAQDRFNEYNTALNEVKSGRKVSHWIWYIFPQIAGLGRSGNSRLYGISSLLEAKAYMENETLSTRLYENTNALLNQEDTAERIFGGLDAIKVRSCMTLFDLVSPNDKFNKVLEKFYQGKRCQRTLAIVKEESETTKGLERPQNKTHRSYSWL